MWLGGVRGWRISCMLWMFLHIAFYLELCDGFPWTLHDLKIWTTFVKTSQCFWGWIFTRSFVDDFAGLKLIWWIWFACFCMIHLSRHPAFVQSFHCNNKLHQHTYPPCWLWKESLSRLSRFPCVFGFCCWLTPITPTVLCVSTCSDGLFDFHMVAELV